MATWRSSAASSGTICRYCDNHVTARYARVFGDNEGRVHRCPACDSEKRLALGSAAGKDIAWPDPQEYPERQGGEGV